MLAFVGDASATAATALALVLGVLPATGIVAEESAPGVKQTIG